MPCFQGLAVSIHTPDGPLPEYSIQRQSRLHRIASYIPVPPAKVPAGSTSNKPEQSTFAISITLLTPGLNVPYSTPRPTPEDPYPRAKIVGGLPGLGAERGKYGPVIGPYVPLTASPNETVAAYIYFDGRPKEEVATLLRRGEETWVNSRWVSVPESEGGGLAEREFLFREVGLERWLNGLDLEGKDVAARLERRKQRLEKKRRKKREMKGSDDDDEVEMLTKPIDRNGVLRYGENKNAPVESLSGDEGLFTSDSDSEDEPPTPEAAGQIKVALFRVLASGEIKKGEYSPQFDAHDDDDGSAQNGESSNGDADVDHTTSFAKPKSLDPKSISTQTVTGIDPPDKPYAVFTFFYRGEKQLRKMGILASENTVPQTPVAAKRKSQGLDFSSIKPLTNSGVKNFVGYRDPSATPAKARKGKDGEKNFDAMDSDADDDDDANVGAADDNYEVADVKAETGMLSPEDAMRQGELADGMRKIKLKRQHSADPVTASGTSNATTASGSGTPTSTTGAGPSIKLEPGTSTTNALAASLGDVEPAALVGSPFKKQRNSLPGFGGADDDARHALSLPPSASNSAGAQQGRSMSESGLKQEREVEVKNEHHMSEDEEL
ncbi:hypothetical protein K490DRAFT_47879 [Saccharata proteae CBS 121410]|uniref:DUF7918 domain-containing protein n=1 Tax=Saccharata proteae CBS 121410 TaxID=1314787 RepID=A0A9P4HQS1_9PEZI|nr:hypothetical protein K490DRAFT_47879 [Saccharata proteae CBS 121410]